MRAVVRGSWGGPEVAAARRRKLPREEAAPKSRLQQAGTLTWRWWEEDSASSPLIASPAEISQAGILQQCWPFDPLHPPAYFSICFDRRKEGRWGWRKVIQTATCSS